MDHSHFKWHDDFNLLFKMFFIIKLYWSCMFWIICRSLSFSFFIFYEPIIITRYLIPACLCSAKCREFVGNGVSCGWFFLKMENCVGAPLYSQKRPLYVPRLDRQHTSGPSTEPRHQSESELRYGWRSAGVEPHLQLMPRYFNALRDSFSFIFLAHPP